jgi:bacillithiol biosynthesis cysteine-adding enzyme BshC
LVRVPLHLEDLAAPPLRFEEEDRLELATALESHLAPLTPPVPVLDSLRQLRRADALCVVTGQQPGLCASPLYNLWKGLHAVRLARALAQRLERPVVPLFWNHADDHDLAEVHHLHLLNKNLDIQKVGLAGMSSGRMPLSRVVFDEEKHRLSALRAAMEEAVHGSPHAARALDMCLPRAGETFASAWTRTMVDLLGPHGLVVLEPDWLRTRFSRALAGLVAADCFEELVRGAQAVRARGYDAAIEPAEAALVFRQDEKGRRALRVVAGEWRYDGEDGSRTSAELAAEIVQEPQLWSPGALLRPLVQDLALPSIAYIGGHGELGYHAQLGAVRAALDLPRTSFVPRLSCTVVEPAVRLALAKLGVATEEILAARGTWQPQAEVHATPEVFARLRQVARDGARTLDGCREDLAALDKGLAVHLKRIGDQLKKSVEEIVIKAERVQQNRSGKGRRHERRANNALVPRGLPQERVFGPLALVAAHGVEWIGDLLGQIDPLPREHLVVHLGADLVEEGT